MKKTIKKFEQYHSIEEKSISQYLNDIEYGDYNELTNDLFEFISNEGWLESIEEEYDMEYEKSDFEYLILNISNVDKKGLINSDDYVLDKFNELDIKIKEGGEYPYDTLDFIDYDNGIVYIIRLI